MSGYMKAPCQHCPFRRDVRPFLHPQRAEEIAYSSDNPYSDFPCHKTLEYDEDEGDTYAGKDSKTCAGWLAMGINSGAQEEPEGWRWPTNVYSDHYEMVEAYEEEWAKQRKTTSAA